MLTEETVLQIFINMYIGRWSRSLMALKKTSCTWTYRTGSATKVRWKEKRPRLQPDFLCRFSRECFLFERLCILDHTDKILLGLFNCK